MAPTKGSGFVFLLQSAHPSFIHASSVSGTSFGTPASSDGDESTITFTRQGGKMQRAHLFEALWMVNQGIDNAVQGLQRLKKKSELLQEPYEEAIGRLESKRWNLRFFAAMEITQQRDAEQAASSEA
jgi:hypothetical protein